ncbi:YnfC family lipoprotein [Klebsiella variicola subsp. variicola]|nr:YnfC family lipoprotein [Klebsiella variicola subsp. variicola]
MITVCIIRARGKETTATYRCDSDGYPLGKPPPPKKSNLPSPPRRRKIRAREMDYTAISTFNERTLGTVHARPATTIATTIR